MQTLFLIGLLLLAVQLEDTSIFNADLQAQPVGPGQQNPGQGNPAGKTYVRPYDLYDPRFCYLTPHQFLCEQCLKSRQQFVQILSFEADGRPVRSYACRAYKRPYLN